MNEKILIVDDDPDMMHIMAHILKDAGYQVIAAYGAEDAIRKVRLHKVDLVLTDLAMPKVSGVEVVRAVKCDPETAHIPVVAVTAHVWEGLATSAGQVGCDGFILKPFANRQLLLEVKKYLDRPKAP